MRLNKPERYFGRRGVRCPGEKEKEKEKENVVVLVCAHCTGYCTVQATAAEDLIRTSRSFGAFNQPFRRLCFWWSRAVDAEKAGTSKRATQERQQGDTSLPPRSDFFA
jgi:hypothetical protein